MRVLITGGAGFIGANLARNLLDCGRVREVVVLDDLSTGHLENLEGLAVELHVGSILDEGLLDQVVRGASAVVHLAARPSVPRSLADPMATHHVNATGTLAVLEAVRRHGCPHVILASSSSVYGANPILPKSEALRPEPMSPYAVSKLTGESYARAYAHCFGIRALAFRFFNVFGPLQTAGHAYAAVIPTFIDAAMRVEPLPVNGDGTQSRDFTYVGSVCGVITAALLRGLAYPEPVNLAFGSRRSLLDVIGLLEVLLGQELIREHRPPRPGDVPHSQADQSVLRGLLPDVAPVDFQEGLEQTVSWFRSRAGALV